MRDQVPIKNMVTQLKAKEQPEPWHSSKKKNARTPRPKPSVSKGSTSKENGVHKVHGEPRKRGRACPKSTAKAVAALKGMKKTRRVGASAVNLLLGLSATSVADVEELRRKRQADAEAAGRTVCTVSPHQRKRKSSTRVMGNSAAKDVGNDYATVGVSVAPTSPLQSSPCVPTTEENPREKASAGMVLGAAEEERESLPSQRPGKGPVEDELEHVNPYYGHPHKCRSPLRDHVAIGLNGDSRHRSEGHRGGQPRLVSSPTKRNSRDSYERRQVERSQSRNEGFRAYQHIDDSPFRSPQRRMTWNGPVRERHSPARSESRSPVRWRGRPCNSGNNFREHDEYPFFHRGHEGTYRGSYSRDRGHHREYESVSPDFSRQDWGSRSKENSRTTLRKNRSPYSSTSPRRRSMNPVDLMSKDWRDSGALKEEDIVVLSPTSDRRRCRHIQASVDAKKAKRQRQGNKPFYLTIDREGRPYGPGKPVWIAEINKLAAGLDPSCTHIRKQTFEAVQTFRDRLDENFDYSGTLNEDYLRSLMGKAVTKRRSELISMIKTNQKPQHTEKYIGSEIWKRLEKLASSKQRQQKLEQGRYANSCHRVVGRTGRRGIDAVREKLRSLLKRSPDPSEVEEEMQRDKGYGGHKRKQPSYTLEDDTNSEEVRYADEEACDQMNSREDYSESGEDEVRQRHLIDNILEDGERYGYGIADWDVSARTVDGAQTGFSEMEDNEMTKDDYIDEIEAKIRLLEEEKAKVSRTSFDATSSKRKK